MKKPTKRCNKCGKMKPLSAFAKGQKRNPDGLHYSCKECVKTRRRGRPNTQEEQREWNLNMRYGISIKDYNQMFDKQKGRCAICGRHQVDLSRALAVDHDHLTGKVRGLLCPACNRGLGDFQDSRGILFKAMRYLGRKK